jgi:hypothetical protein
MRATAATVRILSPEGAVAPLTRALAPVPSLAGLRLAVLENGKPNARLLLTNLARHLSRRAGMELGPVAGKTSAAHPADAEVLDNLRRSADVVLTGSGD